MSQAAQRLVLVDAFAILFRAFFALPLMTSDDGNYTNAVYGFTRILLNVIDELEPSCIAIAFDSEGPTFRSQDFAAYKAHREPPPPEFIPQIGLSQQVVDALNIPRFELKGWEADDIIGTLSQQAVSDWQDASINGEVIIVTGDQDLFQLVDDAKNIKVFIPGVRGRESVLYDEAGVIDKLQVESSQVIDYKGLMGDTSDNIPGIKGIGPKTAVSLLAESQSLEQLYRRVEHVIPQAEWQTIEAKSLKTFAKELNISPSILKKLIENKEIAFTSRQLATIACDVPIRLDLDECQLNAYDKGEVYALFEKLSFKSLLGRLPDDQFETDVQEAFL